MPDTVPVTLPTMGESVTEGTIVEWRRKPGEAVTEGEVLADVTTDKVDVEVPAPASGVLVRVLVEAGSSAAVGAVIGEIAAGATAGAPAPAPAPAPGGDGRAPASATPPPPAPAPAPAPKPAARGRGRAAVPSGNGTEPAAPAEGVDVTLPPMGESVTEGTVSRWLKQVGDPVTRDEPLVEVTTDKVDVEVPAPATGRLAEIRAQPGASVQVGGVLGVVAAGAAAETEEPAPAPSPEPRAAAAPAPAPAPVAAAGGDGDGAVAEPPAPPVAPTSPHRPDPAASPLARRAAAIQGVDLATVRGSGPAGLVRGGDVTAAASA
ncbi:MAG TPA: biotin/lipoyl-containing protein, partial [Candidatus Dormibacteraeota bacterium]